MRNSDADTTSTPVPTVSEDISMAPTEAVAAPKKFAAGNSWPNHGGNIQNTRFSKSENKIGPENVDQLAVKWSKQLGGNIQATPVVYKGVVYITDRGGKVWALDEDTGAEIWQTTLSTGSESRNAPAIYIAENKEDNLLIMGDQLGYVIALKMADGTEEWKRKHTNNSTPNGAFDRITQAPTVFQDRVYVGFASHEELLAIFPWFTCCNFVGSFWALDATNGDEIWHTDMVEGNLPRGVIDASDPENPILGVFRCSYLGKCSGHRS